MSKLRALRNRLARLTQPRAEATVETSVTALTAERDPALDISALVSQGDAANRERRWDDAERFYREALRLDDRLAHIWVQYGHMIKEQGRLEQAEEAYRKAIETSPHDPDAHLQLAHCLKINRKFKEARDLFSKAATLSSNPDEARRELIQLEYLLSIVPKSNNGQQGGDRTARESQKTILMPHYDAIADHSLPGYWRAAIPDPQFLIADAKGNTQFKKGHYVLSINTLTPHELHRPILYFDTGQSFNDEEKQLLEFVLKGGPRYEARFELPKDTVRVRFDPTDTSLLFHLSDVSVFFADNANRRVSYSADHDSYRSAYERATSIANGARGPHFAADRNFSINRNAASPKILAYYLPQFHTFSENDEWWGKGFTEWTNVTKAMPVFHGHEQPKLPSSLGFYDLTNVETMRKQAKLASQYGISGFCFHFYWFGGKRLMEAPLLNWLKTKDIDLQFCLCWANENWSRRWDGADHELLISQSHSEADDVAFINYISQYFQDSRYIRVDGKPVLFVYRIELLPNPAETVNRWREQAARLGFNDLYLVATNSFGFSDYARYGFDALAQFPPHAVAAAEITQQLDILDPAYKDTFIHILPWSNTPGNSIKT